MSNSSLFLGFDLSTQQLKIVALYENLNVYKTYRVDFDECFGDKYHIVDGVQIKHELGEVSTPVGVFVEAVEVCFDQMVSDNFPFERVKAISGSCQQHGSVYWSERAPSLLSHMAKSNQPLIEQLCPAAFTFQNAPNWQDHSTGKEIAEFEEQVGGAERLSEITGSRGHYRFTGPQIRKLARKNPTLYHKTYRISLISSFLSSLLCGKITRIEESDACGMNVYDIAKSKFDDDLISVAAKCSPKLDGADKHAYDVGVKELKEKLQAVEPIGYKNIGTISGYFVKKYHFPASCKVYSFTGDNLATILSLPLANNDMLVSLGTSTTALIITRNYSPNPCYHMFKHPTMANHYMGMLCYRNGALAREKVRNELNKELKIEDGGWDTFDNILNHTAPLNGDHELGIYFSNDEIIPNAKACTRRFRYDSDGEKIVEVNKWSIKEDVVSVIESQALSCRLRAGPMLEGTSKKTQSKLRSSEYLKVNPPFKKSEISILKKLAERYGDIQSDGQYQTPTAVVSRPKRVFYAGGSSKNEAIVRRFSWILGAKEKNFRTNLSDACALGGCYKAIWSYEVEQNGMESTGDYGDWLSNHFNWDKYVDPVKDISDLWGLYTDGVGILSNVEQLLAK